MNSAIWVLLWHQKIVVEVSIIYTILKRLLHRAIFLAPKSSHKRKANCSSFWDSNSPKSTKLKFTYLSSMNFHYFFIVVNDSTSLYLFRWIGSKAMGDSQSESRVFSVRIVSIDYYLAPPIPGLDISYSSFQGKVHFSFVLCYALLSLPTVVSTMGFFWFSILAIKGRFKILYAIHSLKSMVKW